MATYAVSHQWQPPPTLYYTDGNLRCSSPLATYSMYVYHTAGNLQCTTPLATYGVQYHSDGNLWCTKSWAPRKQVPLIVHPQISKLTKNLRSSRLFKGTMSPD